MPQEWPQLRRAGVRFLLRHRRTFVLGLVGIALLNFVSPLISGTAHTRGVLVAARAIAAGTLITATDLKSAMWPDRLGGRDWPARADQVVGHRSAVAMALGDPITARSLLTRNDATVGTDRVLAPVRVADSATLSLLTSGDTIDLIAAWPASGAGPANATTVASRVRVVSVPTPPKGATYSTDGGLVVLAVAPSTAVRIAAAAVSARISVTLLPH